MLKKFSVYVMIVMAIGFLAQVAGAAAVGPVDPVTKYPVYYTDNNGVSVGGPPPVGDGATAPTNIFSPVIAGNLISVPTGFGDEYFYWIATADRNIFRTRTGRVDVVFGLEAVYGTGVPTAGQQIVFSRLRLRAALPTAGTYTFDHPWGTVTFNVSATDALLKRAINYTWDIGVAAGNFNAVIAQGGDVLKGFLIATGAPVGWVGDGVTSTTVAGGPVRNLVKLTGPAGARLDPATNANFIQTDRFVVSGRQVAAIPTPLAADRVTYTTATSFIDIFGTSAAAAVVTVSGAGVVAVPLDTLVATADANGKFFKRVATSTAAPPATITLNVPASPGFTATTINPAVTDVVYITQADWAGGLLTVAATSSDTLAAPVLTAYNGTTALGVVPGILPVVVPPPSIEVRSAKGGKDNMLIHIVP